MELKEAGPYALIADETMDIFILNHINFTHQLQLNIKCTRFPGKLTVDTTPEPDTAAANVEDGFGATLKKVYCDGSS